ncbi:MAG: hypothetical protein AAF615_03630 [Pseudomonadota bacterium]
MLIILFALIAGVMGSEITAALLLALAIGVDLLGASNLLGNLGPLPVGLSEAVVTTSLMEKTMMVLPAFLVGSVFGGLYRLVRRRF